MPFPSETEILAAHFDSCLQECPSSRLKNAELHASLDRWCSVHRLPSISPKRAAMWLIAAGYRQAASRDNGRCWVGLRLIAEAALPRLDDEADA